MSWIGGKKSLRELIVSLFPLYYERYIEVFGGAGWILFHKNPGNDFEVYNDFNSLLVNLYRCVREKPNELMDALRYCLNSREDFDYVKNCLARDSPASDVQKAAWFYQLIRYSYATLMDYVTEAYPIVVFCKQLENKQRRMMEIQECEILPDGTRHFRPLFQYVIEENRMEEGNFIIEGYHRQVNTISKSLAKRLLENGMPQPIIIALREGVKTA